MKPFASFLAEAFPPKPGAGAGPKPGATAAPGQPKPGAPKPGGAGPVPGGDDDAAGGMPPGLGGQPGAAGGMTGDATELFQMQQDAQMEQERQEAEARAAREAVEAAEREKIKAMRAEADAAVMDDLVTKFNQEDDVVNFYPSLDITDSDRFSDHLDKKMEGEEDEEGIEGEEGKEEDGVEGKDDDEAESDNEAEAGGDPNAADKAVGELDKRDDSAVGQKKGDDLRDHDEDEMAVDHPEQPVQGSDLQGKKSATKADKEPTVTIKKKVKK